MQISEKREYVSGSTESIQRLFVGSVTRPYSFRPDIEGLRGIAILMVVLYHAHVPGFSGGFVGVDVFFVLSGYLITGLLVAEIEHAGRLNFVQFYARRGRRLLPAAVVVVLVTVCASWFLVAPEDSRHIATTAFATSIYISNFWFAYQATDYLGADAETNPLLHTWSLAVEEQFYLLWPILVFMALRGQTDRRRLIICMVLVTASSLAVSIMLTNESQPWAFFGSPARAWEFAAGALAGIVVGRSALIGRIAPQLLWMGMSLILVAVFTFSSSTPFPGMYAIVPVLGTVCLLIGGSAEPRSFLSGALTSSGLQWLGRLSYSWYLWHWPALVLADVAFGELQWPLKLLLSVGALGLSQLTYTLIENPIRHQRFLVPRPVFSLALALLLTGMACSAAFMLRSAATKARSDPSQELYVTVRREWSNAQRAGCELDYTATVSPDCVFGVPDARSTIVLHGDSHAMHWFPAFEQFAHGRKLRLVVLTKSACPAPDIPMNAGQLGRAYPECSAWRDNAMDRILRERPSLVVVASSSRYLPSGYNDRRIDVVPPTKWQEGLRRTLMTFDSAALPTLLLLATPYPGFDVPACLARAEWAPWLPANDCTFPRISQRVELAHELEREAAAGLAHVKAVDMSEHVCKTEWCNGLYDGQVVYRDRSHLTAAFASGLTPALAPHILEMLGGRVGSNGEYLSRLITSVHQLPPGHHR